MVYNKNVPKSTKIFAANRSGVQKKGLSNFRRKPERGIKKGLKITPLPLDDGGGFP
jgi:hypothetical protein